MEKRVLIAGILSLLVIFLYQYLMTGFVQPPPKEVELKEDKRVAPPPKVEVSPPRVERVSTVETPLYRATLVDIGGGVTSWQLKGYREDMEEASKMVEIVGLSLATGSTIQTGFAKTNLPEAIPFKVDTESLTLTRGQKGEMVFTWDSPDTSGVRIEKRYTFSGDTYTILMEVSISNNSPQPLKGVITTDLMTPFPPPEGRDGYFHAGPVARINGNILRKAPVGVIKGKIDWVGLEDKYFISALISKDKDVEWSDVHQEGVVRTRLTEPVNLPPQGKMTTLYKTYIGPKEFDTLKGLGVGLEDSVEFGWFAFLAKPLLKLMVFLYGFIPNYGLVIILLTVIIKIIFHPLTRYSVASMKEIQRLQPQMVAIRERYKNDKEKMQKELMDLYKRNRINPLGGCLPIVLQIPVFIALYEALYTSIELRHAPFVFWIKDLSAQDPYYVTPILMGVTMVLQQKMTPTTMDPQQAKIMLIMPIVFTFLFLTFPSGLVLYWLVNNIISIAQQYYIQKTVK